jgi:hypothetical protein
MNWGTKIAIVFTLFATGIMYMVIKSSNEKVELVTADYYAKELTYQNKIEATNRAKALGDSMVITSSANQLTVVLPAFFENKTLAGELVLYCPWDQTKDKKQPINQTGRIISIPVQTHLSGQFVIQLSLKCNAQDYYFEKNAFL